MKKVIIAAAIAVSAFSANASVLKICSVKATEICKELSGQDFTQCYWSQMDWCMEGPAKTWTPYGQTCEEKCLEVSETLYPLCMEECFLTI